MASRYAWRFLLPVLAVALVVRTTRLFESLWYDELWSTRIKLESLWSLAIAGLGDVHPPGYPVLMFVWIRIFGDSELAIRAAPVLAGLCAVLLIYRFGRLAFDEFTGRLAAVMLAVAPVHVWYSQEARSYSLTILLALLGAVAVGELHRRPEARRWQWAGGAALIGLPWLHYYNVATVLVLAWSARRLHPPARLRMLTLSALSVVAIAVYAGIKQQLGLLPTTFGHLRAFDFGESWRLLFSWFLAGDGFRWWPDVGTGKAVTIVPVQLGAAVLCGAGIVRSLRSRNADARIVPALFLVYPVLFVAAAAAGFGHTYIERSALGALPFFVLALAAGLQRLWRLPRFVVAGCLVGLQVAGLSSTVTHRNDLTVAKPREEWRELAAWLDTHLLESDRQTLLLADYPALPLVYYSSSFAERIDFASKLRERGDRIEARINRFGLSAGPVLAWVSRGAGAAERRSREANVLIVDGPLLGPTLDALLKGRVAATVVLVHIGAGETTHPIRHVAASRLFRATDSVRVTGLSATIYRPVAGSTGTVPVQ
jgi:4-amino-4-deoxy-L-arabinose transferase-like glycosyltransferase